MKNIFILLLITWLVIPVNAQTPLTIAEDFTVTDLDGNEFNLFNTLNSNKFVVIDFFYCTCVPCQLNTPKVQFAFQYFGCNTSNVIFIGMDTGDNNAECRLFEENYQNLPGNKFPSISGDEGGGTAVCNTYGINAYPTVILIAPDKNIVERDIWPIADGEYLAGIIEGHGGIPAICSPVGVQEVQDDQLTRYIKSYPNPANNVFNLMFQVGTSASVTFVVENVFGNKVMEISPIGYPLGSYTIQIPVEQLPEGIYMITMLSNMEKMDVCKMVVVN
ncbi:MAG: redoxin domain-containing protein [Bacteroidales bacterium]|nr:redoxin domain-containing protein [Bacteroidales bacterium]